MGMKLMTTLLRPGRFSPLTGDTGLSQSCATGDHIIYPVPMEIFFVPVSPSGSLPYDVGLVAYLL